MSVDASVDSWVQLDPPDPPRPSAAAIMRGLDRGRLARAVLFAVAGSYALYGANAFDQYEISLALVFAIAAIGQDWLMGRAGQISLGAAAFMAVGAYTTAKLSVEPWGVFPIPTIISAVFGGAVGLIVGVTGLRFRGLYLALSTLALQFIISFAGEQYQGSQEAGFTVNTPYVGGVHFNPGKPIIVMLLVVLALTVLALGGMYRRAPGRAWSAIRQNEFAAAVASVNIVRWKLAAFAGSSAVIAIAGSMYAYVTANVNYVPFNLDMAVSILVMVFVGGLGSMTGAIIGATVVQLLPHWIQVLTDKFHGSPSVSTWLSTNNAELSIAIYGLALLLVLIFERDGIVGLLRRVGSLLSRAARRGTTRAPAS